MAELICYLALEVGLLGLVALFLSRKERTDIASAVHFATLSTMSYQGLASLFFYYTNIPISFSSMNWALLTGSALTLFAALRTNVFSDRAGGTTYLPKTDSSVIFAMLMSYIVAAIAGILFFSTDLVPSSMTGDPARHFQTLVDLTHSGSAIAHKPIYYLWAGLLTHLQSPLTQDKLFVIFNIFSLGLVTSSVSLVMIRILGKTNWRSTILVILLTAFGYPLFALQYGYYTLLLSAAFVFSSFALLLDYLENGCASTYLLHTILVCGAILTHLYFAPELLLAVLGITVWHGAKMQRSARREFFKHAPYWIFAGCIAILSVGSSMRVVGEIIQAKGWGMHDAWANILPFAASSLPYFVAREEPRHNPPLLLLIASTTSFSITMYALYKAGLADLYYVNRNQLILMPLLFIGTAGTLLQMESKLAKVADLIFLVILLLVLAPYFYYQNPPLARTHLKFLDLLEENSGLQYFVNARTTSYSPLQFTSRDRTTLISAVHTCFEKKPEKLAVLGTDHEVIWFGIYTNTYPSLVQREDGFINEQGYIANYKIWRDDTDAKYIAVIKHINHTISPDILSEIKSSTEVVCEGDSFAIYQKLHRQL